MAVLKSLPARTERRADHAADRRNAVSELLTQLDSEDAGQRSAAIKALQKIPEQLDNQLVQWLNNDDAEVRLRAVNILAALRHPAAAEWLITVIRRDAHAGVCAAAIDLLGEVGDHSAVAPLRAVKARFAKDAAVGFAADVALGQIE